MKATVQPDIFGGDGIDVLAEVRSHPQLFKPGFAVWLAENMHIWRAFRAEANKIRRLGRGHYSARTIIHWMRHESTLAENGSDWKINNNNSPDMSRLYMLITPDATGFFETRLMPGADREA